MSIAHTYRRIGLTPSVAQLALAKAILGESLTDAERAAYVEHTGRTDYTAQRFDEATVIKGRKSGGSEYIGAVIAVHIAAVEPHSEPGVVLIVAPSKSDQAIISWRAVNRHLQHGFPDLVSEVVESEGKILLHNGNEIRIASANFRTLRGPKYLAVIVDEACFFYSDDPQDGGSNPLPFILDSVAGGMIATANPLLLLISSPWNRSGVVYEHYRDRDANPDRLVWRASTLAMNPYANQRLMNRHRKDRGENFYRREYLAEFSEDSFAFIESTDIEVAIAKGKPFFPPQPGVTYHLGLDPGRKRDHFGAAIAHKVHDGVFVDWCAEWKPSGTGLKYAAVLPQIWQKAREYRIKKIVSDQIDFGGIEASIPLIGTQPEFVMDRVMTGGSAGADVADVTRALFAARKIVIPDQPGLAEEFSRLADYLTQGGGRDVRAKKGADDRSRAVMLAIYQAFSTKATIMPWVVIMDRKGGCDLDGERGWLKQ